MDTTLILFITSVSISLLVWNRISHKYLWPRIKNLELKKAAEPILLLHCFRFAGLSFLIPGVVGPNLNPAWAMPAAFGDFVAAVLAFTASSITNRTFSRVVMWMFSIWGLADLLLGAVKGPIYNIVPSLGATHFIIVAYVPLLFVTHITLLKLLLKGQK